MTKALINKLNRSLNPVDDFRNSFSDLFDDFFNIKPSQLFENEWSPALDVKEDKKAITIKAEVPGLNEQDLSVTLENDMLTISGKKKEEITDEDKDKKYVVTERRFGSFSRSIRLPKNVKQDNVKADFKNGVLTIVIPREKGEERKHIKIDVNK